MSSSAPNGAPASEANPNPHPVSSSSKPTNANPDPNHQSVSSLVQGGDPNAEVKDVKKKDKKEKKQKGGDKAKDGAAEGAEGPVRPLEMSPPPSFFQSRIALFEEIKSKQEADIASKPKQPIKIQLPPPPSHPHSHSHPDEKKPPVAVAKPSELDTIGGDEEGGDVKFEEIEGAKIVEGTSWETTPLQVARGIAKSLAERAVIAKVNGQLWDLERPLEGSCTLEILDFDHPEGRAVFWHSSAHLLGEAAERHYGCHLCLGPPTEDGFFYEMGLPDGGAVVNTDYPALENVAKKAVAEKQKFERLVVQKEDLLKMFEYNKYKQHLIQSKIPDGTSTTVYRCGPMIDLCRGPHIPNTGMIKAFSIMKNSSSYFLGNNQNDSLQRIYGVSFPDKKRMEEYKTFLAEAAKRDHRKIGTEQELWFFHPLSPGSCFWLPHGTRIYNTLLDFFKSEYRKRGYSEVISPNMYNSELWKTSGHWDKYAENMFKLTVEKEEFGLKPMNCPGHCLMFAQRERSYRELPIRMADFGVLHRNEASGALSGLTRVRRFQQDDAHHFCMPDQIESEILGIFDFIQYVYGINGFTFELQLSTRPEKFLGNVETWDFAEQMLTNALNKFRPGEWGLNPGDGAFYGPKIDITISDALRRKHQCATIQLDFQLPQRFDLGYRPATEKEWITEVEPSSAAAAAAQGSGVGAGAGAEGGVAGEKGEKDGGKEVVAKKKMPRPVMIHRAIAGSIERFTAILTEHYAGKWPFWLSPRQVIIIPAGGYGEEVQRVVEYAAEVKQKLWDAGFYAEADLSDSTMQKKIFNAERGQWNFIFVVGPEERKTRSVNIRVRDDPATKHKGETKDLEETVVRLRKLKDERRLKNGLDE